MQNHNNILDGFNILHLNVQSLRAKHTALECLLTEIDSFDALCFTETWLHEHDSTCFNFINYHHIPSVRHNRSGGSSIFIKEHIKFTTRDDIKTDFWEDNTFEITSIEVCRPLIFIVACIYRSPNTSIPKFIKKIESLFDLASKEKKPLIICGDFNIDILKTSSSAQHFISSVATSNFTHLISHPTRETNHSSTCIDNIITNMPEKINSAGVIETDLSDHYAVFAVVNSNSSEKIHHQKLTSYRRAYNKMTKITFIENIRNQNWSTVFNENDINIKYNNFINIFTQHMNSCFPVRMTTTTISKRNPWFNDEAKLLNNLKHSLRTLSKTHPSLQTTYTKLQKLYNKYISSIKRNYYQNIFLKNKHNPRKTWKTLNHLTGRSTNKVNKNLSLQYETKTTSEPAEIVNLLNNYFCNIGASLNLNSQNSAQNISPAHILPTLQKSFALFDITEEELIKTIKDLKSNSSPGYDEITAELLKLTQPHITEVLLHIFNSSFREGIFPTRMKIAKVIPIFKKGSRTEINNYRPISLLPVLSKCLEKIMFNRVNSFLVKNDIVTHSQFGFTKNKSTVDAMVNFMDKISNQSKNTHTLSVFCDLSKAFDCVNHNIILKKLFSIGIRGLPYKWFQSYLDNRQQYTAITETSTNKSSHHLTIINHASLLKSIERGVPQGSILGPLLFNIYINDLPKSNPNSDDYILYADDTSILINETDPTALGNRLNSAISHTITWLTSNELCLNLTKTNYMHINTTKNRQLSNITPNSPNIIQKTDKTKFLGLHISSDLAWNHHIHHIINKIRPGIAMLYKLKDALETKTLLHIYFSLIHSHLNYAILVWGDAPNTLISQLLKLQKKAIRIILHKSPLTSCRPLFKQLSILTVPSIYILEASCHAKKSLLRLNSDPSHQPARTSNEIHSHYTRQRNNIYIPNCKFSKHDIKSKSSHIYNQLPPQLKSIYNLQKFRLSTKKYLLDDTIYSLKEFTK